MPTDEQKRRAVERVAERLSKAHPDEKRALGVSDSSESVHRKAAEVARNADRKNGG